ncbi:hypothetical protein KMP13_07640 [Epibacterium ulvae]|uniref:calcium-binding protein n=1 Tax=Epibacterium ulvae TaxID=1156985 RepID=UPI001BFC82BE|nr:calcium-binding protein [Epibacterium ulvae]MBT8153768.1 hypothetical protein [Epibacterium ulvae]
MSIISEISATSEVVEGELFLGTAGEDFLQGGEGNDTVSGLEGDDWISGGYGGDDVLTGGAGNDNFYLEFSSDFSAGNDVVTDFSAGDFLYFFNFGGAPVSFDVTYDGNDTLLVLAAGTPGQSTLRLVNYIAGPFEDDTVVDYSFGFGFVPDGVVSDDILTGSAEVQDDLQGYAGDDLLIAVGGNDFLNGGLGNDTLIASDEGGDLLYASGGEDVLIGGTGSDSFEVFDGDNVLTGNGGGDRYEVYIGHGNDTITDFGEGDTLRIFDSQSGVFSISAEYTETDTVLTIAEGTEQESTITLESYILPTYELPEDGFVNLRHTFHGSEFNVVSDDVLFSSADNGFVVSGGAGNDVLIGSDGFDYLYGGIGDDTVLGNATADVINGGEGDDLLEGGSGADTFEFFVHAGEDMDIGFGNDTIRDFEESDWISISIDGTDTSNFDVTLDGTDSILTVGVGTAVESQIVFEDYVLLEESVQVTNTQLSITGQFDFEF